MESPEHGSIMSKVMAIALSVLLCMSCRHDEDRILSRIEQFIQTDDTESAIEIIDSLDETTFSQESRARYITLKTIAYAKNGYEFENDSIISATADLYNPFRKNLHAALSHYAKGLVEVQLDRTAMASDAFTKAIHLFPDTTNRCFAVSQSKLGVIYIQNGLYSKANDILQRARVNYVYQADSESVAYTDYLIALSNLSARKYGLAEQQFTALLSNPNLTEPTRNSCNLHLAKLFFYRDSNIGKSLSLTNQYIAGCSDDIEPASGYSLKGQIYYSILQNDSAYENLRKSVSMAAGNLTTLCIDYKCLRDLCVRMKNYNAAVGFSRQYESLNDSIHRKSLGEEIVRKDIEYTNQIVLQKINATRRIQVLALSLVLIALIASVTMLILRKKLVFKSDYIERNDRYIIEKSEDIPSDNIEQILESSVRSFMDTASFKTLTETHASGAQLSSDDRDMICHDISVHFYKVILKIQEESGKINRNELMLFCCLASGLSSETISDLLCTSRSNLRSMKSRMKSKLNPESEFSGILA